MFRPVRPPRSLEGVVLAVGALVLGLYWVWMAAEPLLSLLPQLGATKTGPAAFPVTVHLGKDHVSFTNGGSVPWTCQAALGISHAYLSTFVLQPNQTRALSYVGFRGTDAAVNPDDAVVHVAAVRSAGRGRMAVMCREPSGITHFRQF